MPRYLEERARIRNRMAFSNPDRICHFPEGAALMLRAGNLFPSLLYFTSDCSLEWTTPGRPQPPINQLLSGEHHRYLERDLFLLHVESLLVLKQVTCSLHAEVMVATMARCARAQASRSVILRYKKRGRITRL